MKKLIFCLFFIPAVTFSQNVHKKISCLFLGNSYTYVNNLPGLIFNIALANGDTMLYDSNTIGSYSFNNHFNDATSISKIKSAQWKFVVLQGQSQEPSFPPNQVNAQTMPYAIKLDSVIKQNYSCSNTVFYETWGRKNGDASNCAFYPPLCTYAGMQERLKQSYKKFADTTRSLMSPAGEAFRRSILLNPTLELYDADESHPSLSGSFLVASVFYEILFQKSVLTSTYNPGISSNTASFLQQVAHNTVDDSLSLWNAGVNFPWADFSYNPVSASYLQFQSESLNDSNTWYFGDGGTSISANPSHNYANPGTYTVTHVVTDPCNKDSINKTVTVLSTGYQTNQLKNEDLILYPNPCKSAIYISCSEEFKNGNYFLEVRNGLGELIYYSPFSNSLPTDIFVNGLYFVKIYNDNKSVNTHFIKNE